MILFYDFASESPLLVIEFLRNNLLRQHIFLLFYLLLLLALTVKKLDSTPSVPQIVGKTSGVKRVVPKSVFRPFVTAMPRFTPNIRSKTQTPIHPQT